MMTATTPLPDPSKLTMHQLQGHACARCAYRLYQSVRIGSVPDLDGSRIELYVCPRCATPQEREAHTTARAAGIAGRCALCDRYADPAVIVGMVLGDAGASWTQYAHPECAEQRGMTPIDLPAPRLPRRVRSDAIRRAAAQAGHWPDLLQRLRAVLPDVPELELDQARAQVWGRIRDGLAGLQDVGGAPGK